MSIGEMCNKDVICCDVTTSIAEVALLMREHHIGTVVVLDRASHARVPVGIVTDRDIVVDAVAAKADLEMISAGDIMAPSLATVREEAGLGETLEKMENLQIRRLPVVRHDGTLYGIVTVDDIVSLLSNELALLTRAISTQAEVEHRVRR